MEGKVWGGFLCLAGQSAQRRAHKAWLLPEEKVCLEAAGQASVQLWTRLLGQGIWPASNLSRLWLLQTWQTVDYLTPGRHPGPCATLVSARAPSNTPGLPMGAGCYQKTVVREGFVCISLQHWFRVSITAAQVAISTEVVYWMGCLCCVSLSGTNGLLDPANKDRRWFFSGFQSVIINALVCWV